MRFATLHLQQLDRALDACVAAREAWVSEEKPSWIGFHRLLDAWHRATTLSTRLNVWMESRLVDDTTRDSIQHSALAFANIANLENQDKMFRRQLWRWTHSPCFHTLTEEQTQAARSSLAGTLTARWPKYKQYQLNRLAAEQTQMEEHFRANLRRDQSSFGVHLVKLGPLSKLPLHVRQTARAKACENGWTGWWFEANDTNYAAFRAGFVPAEFKRAMTLARKRVGVSGTESNAHNGTVLARLAELRRLEARLYGDSNYGTYAWSGNVFSTPRKMSAFLKSTHKALTNTPAPVVQTACREAYRAKQVSPIRAQRELWSLWQTRFGIEVQEVSPLSWIPNAPRYAIKKGTRLLGHVVLDLFHRPNKPKTGLAGYMMDLVKRHRDVNGTLHYPVSYVSMDVSAKKWRHDETITFFHEMGHVLHHLAASSELPATNWSDIEQDATEWPSLLMESWAWEPQTIRSLFGERCVAPFKKIRQHTRYSSMVTGLQVAWMDLKMHASRKSREDQPRTWVEEAKQYIPHLNRLLADDWARWDHLMIMQGTYAGYLWSEQLAANIGQHVNAASSSEEWEAFWQAVWTRGGKSYVCASLEEWRPGVTAVSPSAFLSA